MTSIAIIGPGSIGGVLAGALQGGGRHHLALCSRRPLAALVVETTAGRVTLPAALTDPAQGRRVDWVLVATKAYDAAGAAAWFPTLVGPATRVAIVQNGVEHRERFAPWLPPERLLPVMIDCPAERRSPGHVVQRGPGRMAVPAGKAGEEFAALFAGTTLEAQAVEDFRTAVWRKLCINSAGIINALLLKPAGVFHDDGIARLALAIVRECIAVGRAEGAVIEEDFAETVLANYRKAPRDAVNSLHADRAAGRPMEIDARNGAIVRFGRKHGVPTPCNEMAATLLAAM
ncbi:MAG TPA: 2-dehydropantoate 2-reductase [Lacunisphaera sp.]|nr:2-dehydropantoate 2-reductase [Lacunisphaera sp.]